ncbi:HlyD family secretion protein [Novosphingobium sp. ZN18A2]|uniref:HlyD family secretion protein n=1 Tax=Novosphingobium sp. ZN18A2 TaxID=3079861 RepID=UPI0030CF92C2
MAEADPFNAEEGAVADAKAPSQIHRKHQGRARMVVMLLVPLLIVGGVAWWWFGSTGTESTDNAYVKGDIVSVAGEVTGKIVSVNVTENQMVKKGDVLFTIDPDPYRVAINQADAQIAQAQARITALRADVGANAADLAGARNDLALAQANYRREKELMERGFNTRARMDAAEHAVAAARDHIASIQADVAKAQAQLATGAQVPGVNPEVAAARAARSKAELDLSRTVVRAPASGRVSQTGKVLVGSMVFPGVPMVSIMKSGSARVDANFKETQLDRMKPGQKAEVRFDAYPGMKLSGHVESIGIGTGSEFSVLPAQNATGNWVKITQRVPVRIAIDEKPEHPLIAGLSAEVSVDVGKD